MNLHSTKGTKLNINELTHLAILSALMVVGKEALSFIPNVHPVMLLIIVTTLVYGWHALLCVFCFTLIEILIYGLGIWTIMYIYIWPLAVALVMLFRKEQSRLFWACFAAGFGLIFGALCALPYIFTSGIKAAALYWVSGIPYDLIHAAANYIIIYFLREPLTKLLTKL